MSLDEEREDNEIELVIFNEEFLQLEKKHEQISTSIEELIKNYSLSKKNKEKTKIMDQLGEFISYPEVKDFLKDTAREDSYDLCRAKAVSYFSELTSDEEIKGLLIQKLDDSSPKVRLWAVWSLRGEIHDEIVQSEFIRRLKYIEKAKTVRLWIIRSLGDVIENENIQYVFLHLLKQKPDTETRKLLLYYLLQKLNNRDICYYISSYVTLEVNKNIRKEIVKKMIEVDNEDIKYALNKLAKIEKDKEIIDLISSKL
ncbi:MAG: HEAT repeat domain-containing protein [Candidatus Thorarchaeota archaeon]